jgi:glycosyltransferase involved in cell wall biosynthesis
MDSPRVKTIAGKAASPLVSVVLPTFNSERFLVETLQSVLTQDYRTFEIIAVDDGSTDGTLDLLRAQPEVTWIEQPHRGVAAARNAAIASARGSILSFLDSDDLWPSDRLTVAVAHLEAHPEVGYVLGRQRMFAEPGCPVPSWVRPEWLAAPHDAANAGVLVVRREVFARVGGFNIDFALGEDTEWLTRASEARIPMTRLPDVLLHRRLHGANLSIKTLDRRKEALARIARESIHRRRHSPGS